MSWRGTRYVIHLVAHAPRTLSLQDWKKVVPAIRSMSSLSSAQRTNRMPPAREVRVRWCVCVGHVWVIAQTGCRLQGRSVYGGVWVIAQTRCRLRRKSMPVVDGSLRAPAHPHTSTCRRGGRSHAQEERGLQPRLQVTLHACLRDSQRTPFTSKGWRRPSSARGGGREGEGGAPRTASAHAR